MPDTPASSHTFTHHALEHMDAYVPVNKSNTPRPAIVFVHGGGYRKGSREQFQQHAIEAAQLGYVTATVSYRLTGVAKWPAQIEDIRDRMRELLAQAEVWQMDTQRIAMVGSSAGAHLATYYGVRPGDDLPRPACIAAIHGRYDCSSGSDAPWLISLLGEFETQRDNWRDASPIHFVDEHTPAMLLTHDPDDPTIPYDQSVQMTHALAQAHRPVAFIPTPGSGHGFFYNLENPWAKRIWPRVLNYLHDQLYTAHENDPS